jgi:hypothetical protein
MYIIEDWTGARIHRTGWPTEGWPTLEDASSALLTALGPDATDDEIGEYYIEPTTDDTTND